MIYFIYKNNTVYGCTEFEETIEDIAIANSLEDYEVGTTDFEDYAPSNNKYLLQEGEIVLNPNYELELAEARKEEFLKQFFKIDGYGYFRKQPKGYGSAVESLNTAFNIVTVIGNLPANTLTFYAEPDFTIAEQCTEEWLVENATKNEVMTPSEFGTFYAQFTMAWNSQEHL